MPFLNELDVELIDDTNWRLTGPLRYESALTGLVIVPAGFDTDFSSVPRLPVIYSLWGDRAHRESVLHDYLYCRGADPELDFTACNRVFLQAMESRGVPWWIRYPMYRAACTFGGSHYKMRSVTDRMEP